MRRDGPLTLALSRAALFPLLLVAACSGGGGDPAPVPVEGFAAEGEDQAVLLSWTLAPPGFTYRIAYSTQAGFDPAAAATLDATTSPYLHQGLANGTPVNYRIATVSGSAVGVFSEELAATPGFTEDPLFKEQWHLDNTGEGPAVAGEDLNVLEAWGAGFEGGGVVISIVDDGLEILHEDLVANVVPDGSYSYVDGSTDPTRGEHGTSCGGLAAARGGNGVGLRGSAPHARLVCYDFLSDATVANQADAMVRGIGLVEITSNSWGPEDSTGGLGYAEPAWQDAIVHGITNGRDGRGIVYLIAGGNGHLGPPGGSFGLYDDSNYNGFANHRGVIAIGAVDHRGIRAAYSERGANLLVCAPSARSGSPPSPPNPKIATCDRSGAEGYNTGGQSFEFADLAYTKAFDGTSAATPMAAGVVALVLQARPELSWRDVREVLATSARRNHESNADWVESPAGHWVNHNYGFGVIDAGAAVAAAQPWSLVGPQQTFETANLAPDLPIPDDDAAGVTVLIPVSGSGIGHAEFVEVWFTSDHPFPPDLELRLESPNPAPGGAFESVLAVAHDTTQETPLTYNNWRFGSVRHLGEAVDGTWRLHVADRAALDTGKVAAVRLVFHGR